MFKTKKVRDLEDTISGLTEELNRRIEKEINDTKAINNLQKLVKLEVIGIAPNINQFYILSIKCEETDIRVIISKEQKEIFMKSFKQNDIYRYRNKEIEIY